MFPGFAQTTIVKMALQFSGQQLLNTKYFETQNILRTFFALHSSADK